MSVNTHFKNIINNIAQSDLENNYIVPGNSSKKPLSLVTPTKVSSLLRNFFDWKKTKYTDERFFNALQILSSLSEDNACRNDPQVVRNIFKVCDKLRHKINKIEDSHFCKKAYTKISDLLVKTALIPNEKIKVTNHDLI
jgi:hypothetical protein